MNSKKVNYVIGFISAPQDNAEMIAKEIVEKKLASCVQIIGPLTSLYWWENKVQQDTEAILLLKTKTFLIDKIQVFIKSIHPYDIPEIIFTPITSALPAYLKWIDETVTDNSD